MGFVNDITTVVKMLESYRGRDKILRMVTYVAMFMGSDGKTEAQIKWRTIAGEVGAARTILRLFDDLPMLFINISTGFGLQNKRPLLRILDFMSAILNQSFYPSEHIAWLQQKKIIQGEPRSYLLLGIFIWACSLAVDIIKQIIKILYLSKDAVKILKQKELDKDCAGTEDTSSSQNAEIKRALNNLSEERRLCKIQLLKSCFDLTNAVSWLPPGILWAGKLSPRTNGILGTIATSIMLYQAWPSKKSS